MRISGRFLLLALLIFSLPGLTQTSKAWPRAAKQAAINGCRQSILAHAERDYLASKSLRRDQLPPDFREQLTRGLEPVLRTCDCVIGKLETEMSVEYFTSHPAEVNARSQALIRTPECAPKRGAS